MADLTALNSFKIAIFEALPEFIQGEMVENELSALVEMYASFFDTITRAFKERNGLVNTQQSLNLLQAERDVEKIDGELVDLTRVRVQKSLYNKLLSGTHEGFGRILETMGLSDGRKRIATVSGAYWDYVFLAIDDGETTIERSVLSELASTKYGRVGRIFSGVLSIPTFSYDLPENNYLKSGYDYGKYFQFEV